MYRLISNREVKPRNPVTIVIANEVHEMTTITQTIIGLARRQMEVNSGMVLILISVTVCGEVKIEQHEFAVKRSYMARSLSSLENILILTARLIVTLHHAHGNKNLVKGIPADRFCDHFQAFCPGNPQMRVLANLLIR